MSNKSMEHARTLVERHLTQTLVAKLRSAAAVKAGAFNLKPNQLIGVIKVDEGGKAYWSVEQRFGFPYQDIADRTVRRIVFDALEEQDDENTLRIVFLDMPNGHASSLRISYESQAAPDAS